MGTPNKRTAASSYDRDFGGIKVSAIGAARVTHLVLEHLLAREPLSITFLNPDYARRAFRDERLRSQINGFDLVLVDGNGVRWLAPLFGFRIPQRLDTDSLTPRLFTGLGEASVSVFLFGCAPGVAERAGARVSGAFAAINVAGTEHGYWDVQRGHPGSFDSEDSDRIVARINASGAGFVLVSLPTPLQQQWAAEHRRGVEAPIIMTGGSFLDHVAETDKWPEPWYPDWANRFSLNWFYRLVREPRRLWRRYTVEMVQFVWLAFRARLAPTPD